MSDPGDLLPVTRQICGRCGGEGMLYTSRYGGNDPDVWATGECPECDGAGYALCETEEIDEEDIMSKSPYELSNEKRARARVYARRSTERYNRMVLEDVERLRATRPKIDLIAYYRRMDELSAACPHPAHTREYFDWINARLEDPAKEKGEHAAGAVAGPEGHSA